MDVCFFYFVNMTLSEYKIKVLHSGCRCMLHFIGVVADGQDTGILSIFWFTLETTMQQYASFPSSH